MTLFGFEFHQIISAQPGEPASILPDAPTTFDVTTRSGKFWNLPPHFFRFSNVLTAQHIPGHHLITHRGPDGRTIAVSVI